jgi:hypothetical protein
MKRYTKGQITKVHTLLKRGLPITEIATRTRVKPFSINYYKSKTSPVKGIRSLQKLITRFQRELDRLSF